MMDVQIEIDKKQIDCIIEWYKGYQVNSAISEIHIDAILNMLLIKTCIEHDVPFQVWVQPKGGD